MVMVTRLNGKEFYINPDLIQFLEETPDTVITLSDGKKLVAREKAETIIERIIQYRTEIFIKLPVLSKQDL
ncbi:MAG: flagellar FlbD family protein [Oscillospiraceae bacterium]|jgi:flagellar protein FlbD|nr:flagellar FlbD family protein [Oscillospiraceae bacterium]